MNSESSVEDRRRALESYLDDQDRDHLNTMRRELVAEEREAELASATGIKDRIILAELDKVDSDIGALAALGLIPLVEVAWADGTISPEESTAILQAAASMGVSEGSQSYALLEKWLVTRVSHGAVAAWRDYVKALAKVWGRERTGQIRNAIIGRAESVAQATGGILGLGNKVSPKEQLVLNELDSAFGV
jgi:hypothetical protein